MVTVEMTEAEYKAYQLYLKSVKVMLRSKRKNSKKSSMADYLADPDNIDALEKGLRDVEEGKISYINPDNLWDEIN
jgi:hypothetical protein